LKRRARSPPERRWKSRHRKLERSGDAFALIDEWDGFAAVILVGSRCRGESRDVSFVAGRRDENGLDHRWFLSAAARRLT
jgi:hypothetical protein